MAPTLPIVQVSGVKDAIVAAITATFPDFKLVAFDREETDRDELDADDLPAVLLDLSEFEEEAEYDRANGLVPLRARFDARVVVGYKTARAKTAAQAAAVTMAAWLRLKRFNSPSCWTEPARVIGAYRDEFHPMADRYVVWRIEWSQVVQFGTDIYADDNDGTTPGNPSFSFAPDIGLGHEADYTPLLPQGGAQ
jgi:hypothetical protein